MILTGVWQIPHVCVCALLSSPGYSPGLYWALPRFPGLSCAPLGFLALCCSSGLSCAPLNSRGLYYNVFEHKHVLMQIGTDDVLRGHLKRLWFPEHPPKTFDTLYFVLSV